MIRIRAGMATDVGRVRANNQDRAVVTEGLVAVADGMGGHRGGEVASTTALEALIRAWADTPAPQGPDDLSRAASTANRAVFQTAARDADLAGMGTTLTVLAAVRSGPDDVLAIAHVGDSRAYRLRGGELEQLTDDHSYVAELMRDGRLTAEQARTHSQRSIVTRAVGVEPHVEVDLLEILPSPGHRYLLCSDGLTGEVSDEIISSYLRRLADPAEAARALVAAANDGGGRDNITVVVVDVLGAETDLTVDEDADDPTHVLVGGPVLGLATVADDGLADAIPPPPAPPLVRSEPADRPDADPDSHEDPAGSLRPLVRRRSRAARVRGAVGALIALIVLGGLAAIAWWAVSNDPARTDPPTTVVTVPAVTVDPFEPVETDATGATVVASTTPAATSTVTTRRASTSTAPTASTARPADAGAAVGSGASTGSVTGATASSEDDTARSSANDTKDVTDEDALGVRPGPLQTSGSLTTRSP